MKKEILFLIFILSTIATVSATNPCAVLSDFSEAPFLGQNNAPIEYPYYITNFHQTFSDACNQGHTCDTFESLIKEDLPSYEGVNELIDEDACRTCIAEENTFTITCEDPLNQISAGNKVLASCFDDGVCISETYGDSLNNILELHDSNYRTNRNNCGEPPATGIIETDLDIHNSDQDLIYNKDDGSEVFVFPTGITDYFLGNTDVNNGFYEEMFTDLYESTLVYEFGGLQGTDPKDVLSVISQMLARTNTPYCKSVEKISTSTEGDRYIIFIDTSDLDNEMETLLTIGQVSLYGNRDFHDIDDHLSLALLGHNTDRSVMSDWERCIPSTTSPTGVDICSDLVESGNKHLSNSASTSNPSSHFPGTSIGCCNGQRLYETKWPLGTGNNANGFFNILKQKSFEEKCEYLQNSVFRRGPEGWSRTSGMSGNIPYNNFRASVVAPNVPMVLANNDYAVADFEYINPSRDFESTPLEADFIWQSTNVIETTCLENPITVGDITLRHDDPTIDDKLEEFGIDAIIVNKKVWLDNILPSGFSSPPYFPLNFVYTDIVLDGYSGLTDYMSISETGTYNINFNVLEMVAGNIKVKFAASKTEQIEVIDKVYLDIQTSLSGNSITPGNPFTFVLNAVDLDGNNLESFKFDPGQRELGNGEFIDVAGEFQCKESKNVQCMIDDSVYEGVPRIGSACGCPIDLSGSGTVYVGEKEGTKDDDGYKRKFDGSKFEYSFSMEYPSKTSCGQDRVCQVEFEVTDENGIKTEKFMELNLPGVQTCEGIYTNSILGSDSTQFVGDINDGEQSCQCKFGYSPVLDDTLSIALGASTKTCIQDTIEINETEAVLPTLPSSGQSNPTWNNNQNGNSNKNSNGLSQEGEERNSSGLTIFLILILVALAGIFGFEFYRKKKTGMFFNPFKKSPTSILGSSEESSQSPLQKFVSDAKKAGEDPETIKQNLRNAGWPENEIDKYI